MRIVMQSQMALIGLKTNNAQMKQHYVQPVIEMETTTGELNMKVDLPKIEIDQQQCFSESGLKGILELSSDNVKAAVQQMYASVGRIADQGNQLSNFHEGNAIADQAYYNAYDQFDNEFNMVTMPMSRPKITVIEGRVNMDPTRTQIKFNPKLSKPELEYTPGRVDIYLRQKNELLIRVEGQNVDLKG